MTFFRHRNCAFLFALWLTACGPASPADGGSENSVQKQVPAAVSSTPSATADAGSENPAAPSPEFASLPAPYNAASYALGRRNWRLCQSCHLTAEGAGHLVGPNLYGLFGRTAGTAEGFAYSKALETAGFAWTPDQLDHWLENPGTFLKGNRMSFAGLRKAEDRQAVIAYLMLETGYVPPAE